jgi:Trk K+ transport system NAD-binding subunit
MQITIVGAGNMGRGIAARALAGRPTVRIIDKDAGKVRQLAADLQGQAAGADV